jgi:hypothetical protein
MQSELTRKAGEVKSGEHRSAHSSKSIKCGISGMSAGGIG